MRLYAPTGALGMGFLDSSLARAVAMRPDVIACDAGSTDSGPFYLGASAPKMSQPALDRDLRRLLRARDELKVPLIIGSCGTSGTDDGVEMMRDLALQIARDEALSFTIGLVYCEQKPATIAQWFDAGKVRALAGAPEIIRDDIVSCSHIVGMAGAEAIQHALDLGADVVFAGRATDTALFATAPLKAGLPEGAVWHCAKTIECGAVCSSIPRADGLLADIDAEGFEVEPAAEDAICTPLGIASHTLYENADPIFIKEPSGTLDTGPAHYAQKSDRRCRVEGSQFKHEPYSIKLEGAAPVGYQTVAIGGIRDPLIIGQVDPWIAEMQAFFAERVTELTGMTVGKEVRIDIATYGKDGVMGTLDPQAGTASHELGILFTVTAPSQEVANQICRFVTHAASHWPIKEWDGFISGIAFPYSPPEIDRGMAYRFVLHHAVFDIDPLDMFRFKTVRAG